MEHRHDFAYVTLVMKGDYYIPGAIVLAQTLWETGTKLDLVCMVTRDVLDAGVQTLKLFFTRVCVVEYINAAYRPMFTRKQNQKYASWMSQSLTTFRCLGLQEYKKVCFIDSDVAVLKNMDEIFELNAPAGTFDSYFRKSNVPPFYPCLNHGQVVPRRVIQNALQSGQHVAIGNCMLLAPHGGDVKNEFETYVDEFKRLNHDMIGFTHNISGTNEQMITDFYTNHLKSDWTHIDLRFQCIPWKPLSFSPDPYLYHYFNVKPWSMNESEFPDLSVWWSAARRAVQRHGGFSQFICMQSEI